MDFIELIDPFFTLFYKRFRFTSFVSTSKFKADNYGIRFELGFYFLRRFIDKCLIYSYEIEKVGFGLFKMKRAKKSFFRKYFLLT